MNQHNRVYVCLFALHAVLRTWIRKIYRFLLNTLKEITRPLLISLARLHHIESPKLGISTDTKHERSRHSRLKYFAGLLIAISATVFMLSQASGLQIKITGEKTVESISEEKLKAASILLKAPVSGEELFKSAILMTDYGRLDLAADYMQTLNGLELDDQEILTIRKQYGTAGLIKLINTPETMVEAQKFASKMDAALERQARDPEYIKIVIADLWKKPAIRNAAIVELRRLGKLALPGVISSWKSDTNPDHKTQLQSIIAYMGQHVVTPLRDAIVTEDHELQAMLIDALGRIGKEEAVHDLLYYAVHADIPKGVQTAAQQAIKRIYNQDSLKFSVAETVKIYSQLAELHFAYRYHWQQLEQGLVEYWYWDESGQLNSKNISPAEASLNAGLKYARLALELDISNTQVQAIYLGLLITRDALSAGWGQALIKGKETGWDQLLLSGPDRVEDVLRLSLKHNRTIAAIPAIRAYAQLVPPEHFVATDSPLMEALNFPDQRVQFMTAKTFLQAYPKSSFKYSTRLMEIIKQNLSDSSDNNVLIIDPNETRAIKMAYGMQSFGYQGIIAKTGKDGFKRCAGGESISLVLVHCNSIDWEVSQTISNFKTDARTKFLPLLIVAPDHLRNRYERITKHDPSLGIIPEAQDNLYFKSLINPFLANLPTPTLSNTERVAHTREALEIVRGLVERPEAAYDITSLENNLILISSNPRLTKETIPVLAKIGSRNSQEKLAYLTLSISFEMETRRLAAAALMENIRVHGNLLSPEIVNELKKNWHDEGDQDLRSLLSGIMGLQPHSDKQLGEQLLNRPPQEKLTLN